MAKPASAKAPAKAAAAPKQNTISRRLVNSVDKASGEWAKAEGRAQQEEIKRDIEDIIRELKRCPAKVKSCRRATLGDFFLRSGRQDEMPMTYQFMYKVPQDLIKPMLQELNPKLNDDTIRLMRKQDKCIIHKLMYLAIVVDPQDPIGPRNKKVWQQSAMSRAQELGNPLAQLSWDRQFVVDWAICGFYKLVAKNEQGEEITLADKTGVRFTHISFRGRIEAHVWVTRHPRTSGHVLMVGCVVI